MYSSISAMSASRPVSPDTEPARTSSEQGPACRAGVVKFGDRSQDSERTPDVVAQTGMDRTHAVGDGLKGLRPSTEAHWFLP